MIPIRRLKRDKSFELLILDFIKCNELTKILPDELPTNATAEQVDNFNLIWKMFDNSMVAMTQYMSEKYDIEGLSEDDLFDIIEDVQGYFVTKYGIDKIMKMKINIKQPEMKNINQLPPSFELMHQLLNEGSNKCNDCNSQRVEIKYESLPKEEQEYFKSEKDEADYFLFCPMCKAYSMMYKAHSHGFGFDD